MYQAPAGVLKLAKNKDMRVTSYFKEVRSEMRHVSWPSRKQTAVYTAVVVGVSLAVAVYLGALDYIFTAVIQTII